jgi:predicted nuclease of predicted toxin-antitoxin system
LIVAVVKLDENVPDLVGTILRDGGHDVALARDENLVGSPDDRLLAAANEEARTIISLDRGFANILRHPPEATAGIVVVQLHTQTLPLIRQAAETLTPQMPRDGHPCTLRMPSFFGRTRQRLSSPS